LADKEAEADWIGELRLATCDNLDRPQASKLREVPAADKSNLAHRCKSADIDLLVVDQVNLNIVVGGQLSGCVDHSCLDCRMLGGASSNTSHKTLVAPNRAAGQQ
jgi:hypothetical protein